MSFHRWNVVAVTTIHRLHVAVWSHHVVAPSGCVKDVCAGVYVCVRVCVCVCVCVCVWWLWGGFICVGFDKWNAVAVTTMPGLYAAPTPLPASADERRRTCGIQKMGARAMGVGVRVAVYM